MAAKTKHIALVCPGARITPELAQQVAEIAAGRHGEKVDLFFHPQCFLDAGHFAGADAERSAAFLEVANDPKYSAIWFARGGYGACRLEENIFSKLNDAAHKKTYLGYSDSGMLLARLYKENIGSVAHGPMPSDLPRANGESAIVRALDYLVTNDSNTLELNVGAGAKTIAFNITVLSHLIGTTAMPDLSGHAIMLEDVSEYLYAIDRSMFTITSDPGVRQAAGIMLGRISDVPENDRPFGADEVEIAQYWCARARISYLGRADIGHDAANKVVPFGGVPAS